MEINHTEQAGKNFAWLSVAQVGVRVMGAAFFLFLTYKLGDSGIGRYSFVASFVPFWFYFIDFGGADYLYREWSRGLHAKAIEHDFFVLFTLRLILVSLVLIPFAIVNYYINREILVSLLIFYCSMFLAMFVHLAELYLQSVNKFKYLAVRQILEKGVAIVAGFGLLFVHASLSMVFLSVLVSQVFSLLYYYFSDILPFKFRLVFDWAYAKQLFFKGMPFLFIGIFTALYARIDIVMLRFYKNFEAVGWYGTAYKFLDMSFIFPSLFMSATFPLLSSLSASLEKQGQLKEFFERCLRILFSAAVIIALSLIFLAPHVVGYFFPASFEPSVLALRILIIGQALSFLSLLFSSLMLVQRKENLSLRIIVLGAVLNIALNFYLIPKFSLYGAAWATVAGETLNLILLQHYTQWQKPKLVLQKFAWLFAINGLLLLCLKHFGQLNNLYLGSVVVLTNAWVLFKISLLKKEDVELFLGPYLNKFKSLRS